MQPHPKSMKCTRRPSELLSMRMFSGLISRWKTPLACISMAASTSCFMMIWERDRVTNELEWWRRNSGWDWKTQSMLSLLWIFQPEHTSHELVGVKMSIFSWALWGLSWGPKAFLISGTSNCKNDLTQGLFIGCCVAFNRSMWSAENFKKEFVLK